MLYVILNIGVGCRSHGTDPGERQFYADKVSRGEHEAAGITEEKGICHMENEKKVNMLRSVLLVFAVVLSFFLVPALFALVPAGAVVTTLSGMASMENIEKAAEELELSQRLYEVVMQEALDGGSVELADFAEEERILRDSFTVEDMNQILIAFLHSAYYDTEPEVDFSGMEKRLRENFISFFEDAFDEVYTCWRTGTESARFSKEFCREFAEDIERQLLREYADYGAVSFSELSERYDAAHGSGAFSKELSERAASIREEWSQEMRETVRSEAREITAEAERELRDSASELTHATEVRDVFDAIRPIGEMNRVVVAVVYAVILGMVLLLVLLYWLDIPGFIVCAVPLFFGGALCKGVGFFEKLAMRYIDEEFLFDSADSVQYEDVIRDVMHEIVTPFFKGVSAFGTQALILSVLLIGCAILRGVMKKNKREAERSYS